MASKLQLGLAPLAVIAVIVVVILAGFIAWRVYDTSVSHKNGTSTSSEASSHPRVASQDFSMIDGVISLKGAPEGWSKANENQLKKQLGDVTYLIQFQLNDSDYLQKSNYIESSAVVKQKTKTRDGKDAYIINVDDSYVATSSCAPQGTKACSFKIGNNYLFTILTVYKQNGQSLPSLDFNGRYINQAISEYVQTIEGMNLNQ